MGKLCIRKDVYQTCKIIPYLSTCLQHYENVGDITSRYFGCLEKEEPQANVSVPCACCFLSKYSSTRTKCSPMPTAKAGVYAAGTL